MNDYLAILKHYWGYNQFRPLQYDIIASIGSGKDTLGLMPTGGGKSITFQVPALAQDGLCLVVTPLIALMKDQVDNLRRKGIQASAIYTGLTPEEIQTNLENCIYGHYKFLYVSPERLGSPRFLEQVHRLNIKMIAVDEAHCISQWGYDFRPSYLNIANIRTLLPSVPVLALTATATPSVVKDIQEQLAFRAPNVFQKSFARPNLIYLVRETEDKEKKLLEILTKTPGSSIVYVRNRRKTQEIAKLLIEHKITADYFHAGLPNKTKDEKQRAWKEGSCRVMVATNAFGMGIDKPDVRSVIHLGIPDSLEAYFQEAGRGGRDEQKAYAALLYNKSDLRQLKKRIYDQFPDKDQIRKVYDYVCYYFQIAIGMGKEKIREFHLQEFCAQYHLPIIPTHHALKILELAGYLEYSDEVEFRSKVQIIVSRNSLYYENMRPREEEVLNCLLRSYTGIFADWVAIDENVMADRCHFEKADVTQALINLSRERILNYMPHKKIPYVALTQERVLSTDLRISQEVYELRRQRLVERIESITQYITGEHRCRTQFLLEYFGEHNPAPCGTCDCCVAHRKKEYLHQVAKEILQALSKKPLSLYELIQLLSFTEKEIIATLRLLIDTDQVFQPSRGIYQLKKGTK